MLNRRHLIALGGGAAFAGAGLVLGVQLRQSARAEPAMPATSDAIDWRALTEEEWRARLSPEAFRVLRKEATERAFTSPLNKETRPGVYHCAGCDLPLFRSDWKYDSGTGWPSFWDYIPDSLGFKADYKLIWPRKEYHCARCGGHQGHVFNDGPAPTGLRYCNNGVALRFRAA